MPASPPSHRLLSNSGDVTRERVRNINVLQHSFLKIGLAMSPCSTVLAYISENLRCMQLLINLSKAVLVQILAKKITHNCKAGHINIQKCLNICSRSEKHSVTFFNKEVTKFFHYSKSEVWSHKEQTCGATRETTVMSLQDLLENLLKYVNW